MEGIKQEECSDDLIQEISPASIHHSEIKSQEKNIQSLQTSQYFKKMEGIPCQDVEKLKQKLEQNNVRHKKNFNQSFQKTILKKVGNAYVFTISVGFFETEIFFLQVNIKQGYIERYPYSSGCFSSIFLHQFKNDFYIIKSQKISEQSVANFDKKFDRLLEEYFANKIASILEFGPKLKKIYGFDIVCFSNHLQFSMELCFSQIGSSSLSKKNYQTDLLAGMKKMHSLQIVHRDIKNQNISWSPSYQKWVFLDFGFSSSIKQKPGEKSFAYFRGTYEYASKEMKNLYHLRDSGFVDLFQNDFQALNLTIRSTFLPKVKIVNSKNSFLFEFLINIIQMKNYILQFDQKSIENIFVSNPDERNEFLGLFLIELERNQILGKKEKTQFFILYDKIKKKSMKQINAEKNEVNKITENINDFQVKKKQKNKYFQLFIKEEPNNKSIFLFANEQKLKELVSNGWSSFAFLKQLFIFFQETLYGNSERAWNRMKLITNILSQFLFPMSEKKSWLWKFHELLFLFEKKFIEKKNYQHLRQVFFLYYFFNDHTGWMRINQILRQNQEEKKKIFNMYCQFYSNLLCFTKITQIHTSFSLIKQTISKSSEKQQPIFIILERLTQRIIYFISSKNSCLNQFKDFQFLLQMLNRQKFEPKQSINFIINWINRWISQFFAQYPLSQEKKVTQNIKINSFSQNKYFQIHQVIQKLNYLMENSNNILQPYLKANPICRELPNVTSFSYYLKKKNLQKLNQIAELVLYFNQNSIEQSIEDLDIFLIRWEKPSKKIQQRKKFVEHFLLSYRANLKKYKQQKLVQYWTFYSRCLRARNFFNNHEQQLKEQVISSFEFIINFFDPEDLSSSNKIYLHFFLSLKKFYEGHPIKAQQFIENLQKDFLIEEFKKNTLIIIDFMQIFSFYQKITQIFSIQKTSIFQQISPTKTINIYFFNSHLLLWNTITNKINSGKQNEAIKVICSYTKYLSELKKKRGIQSLIFKDFLQQNNQTSLKKILVYFLEAVNFLIIRKNSYLSAFILIVYLKLQERHSCILSADEMKRIHRLSTMSIDKFPDCERIALRKILQYKFRGIEKKQIKSRKRRILDRQEDYARGRLVLLKKDFSIKLKNKTKICGEIFQRIFEVKIRKMAKNVVEKCPAFNDNLNF